MIREHSRVLNLHLSLAPRPLQSCPEGWTGPHHSSCFKMINEPATWLEANSNGCGEQDSRAHLAAITADNRAFLSKELSLFGKIDYYWVGLRSTDDKWNSGTQFAVDVDYTNWETAVRHDPDGTTEENDNCVAVAGRLADPSFQPVGGWADASCTDKGPYACDKPQQVRTGPTAATARRQGPVMVGGSVEI